jgi:hypothetical protein
MSLGVLTLKSGFLSTFGSRRSPTKCERMTGLTGLPKRGVGPEAPAIELGSKLKEFTVTAAPILANFKDVAEYF